MLPAEQQSLRGSYFYTRDGKAMDIDEDFLVERLAGQGKNAYRVTGRRLVRSNGTTLATDALMLNGELVQARFEWCDEIGSLSHRYQRQATWQFDESTTELPATTLLFGLLRVFTGPLMLGILQNGGSSSVISPSLSMEQGRDKLFEPGLSSRTASSQGFGDWLSADGLILAHSIRFQGGPYAETSQCWLDEHGLLLGYDWSQPAVGLWQVRLRPG